MNFRLLSAFSAVMTSGSVSEAALILYRSQPSVSRAIMELEAYLGYKLFARVNRSLEPTEEGLLLFAEVERAFRGIESINEVAKAIGNRNQNVVNIVSIPSVSLSVLPITIQNLAQSHPEMCINLELHGTGTEVAAVLQNKCDVGISSSPFKELGVNTQFTVSTETVCVMPTGHPLADQEVVHATDLKKLPLITLSQRYRIGQLINYELNRAGVKQPPVIETQLAEMVCLLVTRGLGVAIVDPYIPYLRPELDLEVRPFLPRIKVEWKAITPANRQISNSTRIFLEELKKTVLNLDKPTSRLS